MEAVSGVFRSRSDAEHAMAEMRSVGLGDHQIALLTPERFDAELQSIPTDATEQPGIAKAIGAVVGATAGLSGASLLISGIRPWCRSHYGDGTVRGTDSGRSRG